MRLEHPAGCSKRPSHPPGGYPGRSERRGEAYSGYPLRSPLQRVSDVEPLSDVRTKLADFFNILLGAWNCARTMKLAQTPKIRQTVKYNHGMPPRFS
ncbi:MAG: hypothetical protein KatS3mg082_2115 [Nitrospiraceae bacterium]|nr:MAG: hypothetical protein KatS3mg082_2115 [Nitrospiraceae bacterium]